MIFVAAALFLLAGSVVLSGSARRLTRVGAWLAPLLLLMFARRWVDAIGSWLGFGDRPNAFADAAEMVLRLVPLVGGVLLFALGTQAWRELQPRPTRSLGSSTSRRPSPSRLKPRLTTQMAKPGVAAPTIGRA